jgi:hypothetical protein
MGLLDSPYVRESTLETLIRRALSPPNVPGGPYFGGCSPWKTPATTQLILVATSGRPDDVCAH